MDERLLQLIGRLGLLEGLPAGASRRCAALGWCACLHWPLCCRERLLYLNSQGAAHSVTAVVCGGRSQRLFLQAPAPHGHHHYHNLNCDCPTTSHYFLCFHKSHIPSTCILRWSSFQAHFSLHISHHLFQHSIQVFFDRAICNLFNSCDCSSHSSHGSAFHLAR